jgi:hypothetical protein
MRPEATLAPLLTAVVMLLPFAPVRAGDAPWLPKPARG